MKRRTFTAAAALVLGPATGAWACGVCVEDKVAATYDHAVVQGAVGASKAVVFCDPGQAVDAQRVRAVARKVRGIDPASIRVSANPAALSFVVDPALQSPQAAAAALRQLLPRGARLAVVRVVDAGGMHTPAAAGL